MYWLASHGSLCLLFYTSQVHVPRGGTAHNGLGSPQYSLIKKMFPRYAHRSICWNHFLNRDNFTQVCSVKQTENLTSKATSSQSPLPVKHGRLSLPKGLKPGKGHQLGPSFKHMSFWETFVIQTNTNGIFVSCQEAFSAILCASYIISVSQIY